MIIEMCLACGVSELKDGKDLITGKCRNCRDKGKNFNKQIIKRQIKQIRRREDIDRSKRNNELSWQDTFEDLGIKDKIVGDLYHKNIKYQQWIKELRKNVFSGGMAGILLTLSAIFVGLISSLFFLSPFLSESKTAPKFLDVLPGIMIGLLFFYKAGPLFFRLKRFNSDENKDVLNLEYENSDLINNNFEEKKTIFNQALIKNFYKRIPLVASHKKKEIENVRVPYRSEKVGSLLFYYGIFVMLGGTIIFACFFSGYGYTFFPLGLYIGKHLIRLGKKVSSISAEEILLADRSLIILFLRSFKEDGLARNYHGIKPRSEVIKLPLLLSFYQKISGSYNLTLEEELERFFLNWGPFIALGKPGEDFATIGAARLYVGNNSWKSSVVDLINNSRIVIWQAGQTASTWWELKTLIQLINPTRLLLIIPDPSSNLKQFKKFFYRANIFLPIKLQMTTSPVNFVAFDKEWKPRYFAMEYVSELKQPFYDSILDLDNTLQTFVSQCEPHEIRYNSLILREPKPAKMPWKIRLIIASLCIWPVLIPVIIIALK